MNQTEHGNSTHGPVIGILAFRSHIPERLGYYKRYFQKRKKSGLVYVFSSNGIDARNRRIDGYSFHPSPGTWTKDTYPFPDVVIDRCYPSSAKTHALLEGILGPNRIFNNRTLITKNQFFTVLNSDNFLSQHLPETKLIKTNLDLLYFLNRHPQVFIKPNGSMKGHGIVVAKKTPRGYSCTFQDGQDQQTVLLSHPLEIWKVLLTAGKSKRKYVIQQAIQSLEYKDGPFSLRTCPMKNGRNQWELLGIIALGSMGKGLVTNYSSGGQRIPLKNLLEAIGPKLPCSIKTFLDKINDLTIRTATSLDKKFGPLGELGIDIVVDKAGKPWLLEANGNPGRVAAYIQTEFPKWPDRMYECLFEYAEYLAGDSEIKRG